VCSAAKISFAKKNCILPSKVNSALEGRVRQFLWSALFERVLPLSSSLRHGPFVSTQNEICVKTFKGLATHFMSTQNRRNSSNNEKSKVWPPLLRTKRMFWTFNLVRFWQISNSTGGPRESKQLLSKLPCNTHDGRAKCCWISLLPASPRFYTPSSIPQKQTRVVPSFVFQLLSLMCFSEEYLSRLWAVGYMHFRKEVHTDLSTFTFYF